MNITQEKTDDLLAKITIHLSPEDYKPEVTDELKKQARKASLPGFRPGKVPVSVVRRMVGLGVLVKKVNEKLGKKLNDYIVEQELNILGDPLPIDKVSEDYFDVHCNKELEFAYEVGLAPDFEVNWEIDEVPVLYELEIDDAYLEKELDQYKDRFGKSSMPKEVAKGDIIFGRLTEVGEEAETEEVEKAGVEEEKGGFEKMIALNPARINNEAVFEPFIGRKLDEELELDIFSLAETVAEIANLLFMSEEEVEALRDKKTSFSIRRINRISMAEMNPEFFNKVFDIAEGSEDWIESEEDFITKLKESMAKNLAIEANHRFRANFREKLMEANQLQLPDTFLKRWLKATNEKMSEEEIEKQYGGFTKNTKWSLITNKIAKDESSLKLEKEEIEDSLLESIRQHMPGIEKEQEEQYLKHAFDNEEIINSHVNRLFEDKLFTYIEEKVQPSRESISVTDFLDLDKENNKEDKA